MVINEGVKTSMGGYVRGHTPPLAHKPLVDQISNERGC